MVEQTDFPSSWTKECDQKRVRVEVGVTDADDYTKAAEEGELTWVEVPTSDVTTWVKRSDSDGDIKRTTKVIFPTSLDGTSVQNVFQRRPSAFQFARVSYKNDDGRYILQSHGYIDGVGGRTNALESVAWIRDFSEFCSAAPLSVTFNNPSVREAVDILATRINEQTPVPITSVDIIPPTYSSIFEQELGRELSEADPFFSTMFGDVTKDTVENQPIRDVDEFEVDTGLDLPYVESLIAAPSPEQFNELVRGISTRTFRAERDTISDGLAWLTSKLSARWFFEPNNNGVRLVIDILSQSRNYVGEEVLQAAEIDDSILPQVENPSEYTYVDTVSVLQNDALRQIGARNTLTVRGTSKKSVLGSLTNPDVGTLDAIVPSKEYPEATVTSERLKEAMGDTTLRGETVETDARTKGEAEGDAIKTFQEKLADEDNGTIRTLGAPTILPNDTIDSFEVCEDFVDVETLPVKYEVSEVKHMAPATDFYKTELRVGIQLDVENISVESRMVDPSEDD